MLDLLRTCSRGKDLRIFAVKEMTILTEMVAIRIFQILDLPLHL